MAATANTIISRARIAFPEMGATIALDLLNDAHAEFLTRYPLRQDVLTVPLTANTREYALAETAIQIEAAYYHQDALNVRQLEAFSQHELDEIKPGWRNQSYGIPQGYYLAGSLTSGIVGLHPKPNDSTIGIMSASNATPIAISTSSPHGVANGAAVLIVDVSGSPNANGLRYAGFVTATTFELFADPALSVPIGTSTSGTGGYVIAAGSPAVRLYIRRNQTLTGTDPVPGCLLNIEPYVYSICRRWTEMTLDPNEWQKWQRLEYDAVHKMELYLSERAGQSAAVLKPHFVQARRIY